MLRALGLARVSTAEQSTPDHFSLLHQAEVIRNYTRQHQCDLIDIIQYVQSGGRNRTTLQKVLQRVKRDRIHLVVVAELDRLSRDLVATMSFIEHLHLMGCRFVAVKEGFDAADPLGHMQTAIISTFSQYFRAQLAHKVRGGQDERFKQGKYHGGTRPFGYTPGSDGHWVIVPAEAEWVRQIFRWYVTDDWGVFRIAQTLNDRGVPTARGGRWSNNGVRFILENETYCGMTYHGKHHQVGSAHRVADHYAVMADTHPAIVDAQVFAQAQGRRQAKRALGPHARKSAYLLSGITRCGVCRGSMVVNHGSEYLCRQGRLHACPNRVRVPIQELEQAVMTALQTELVRAQTDFSRDHWVRWSALDPRAESWWEQKRVREQQAHVMAQRVKRAKDAFLAGVFTLAEYQAVQSEADKPLMPDLPPDAQGMVTGLLTRTVAWYQEALAATDKTPYRARIQAILHQITCVPHETPQVIFRSPEVSDRDPILGHREVAATTDPSPILSD